jgi:hypothetical protein
VNYLVFPDRAAAEARTHTEALARGCNPSGVTQYWWAQITHPTSGQWAIVIPDEDVAGLTADEQSALQTQDQMDSAGWFPAP